LKAIDSEKQLLVQHDAFEFLPPGEVPEILDKFGMADSNPCTSPSDTRPRKKTSEESAADITVYRQAIGSLLYAALVSRPDIAYAAGGVYHENFVQMIGLG
jgi:hypothetical protein